MVKGAVTQKLRIRITLEQPRQGHHSGLITLKSPSRFSGSIL